MAICKEKTPHGRDFFVSKLAPRRSHAGTGSGSLSSTYGRAQTLAYELLRDFPSTAIGQSFEPAILIALEDLVAGLARDIELPTQRRHLLALGQSRHKSQPLIHLATLLPRHFALAQKPEVLPMSPE